MSVYEKEFIVDGKFRRKIVKDEDGVIRIIDIGEANFADKKKVELVNTIKLQTESVITGDKPDKYKENIINDSKNLALNFGIIGIGNAGISIAKEFRERGYNRIISYDKERENLFSDEKYIDALLDELGMCFGITLDYVVMCFGCGAFADACYTRLYDIVQAYFDKIKKECKVIFIVPSPMHRESKFIRDTFKEVNTFAQKNKISLISIDNDLFVKKHPKYFISKTLGIANRTIVGLLAAFNDYSSRKSIHKGLSRELFENLIRSSKIMFGATGIESLANIDKIQEIAEKNLKSLYINVAFKANTRVSVVLLAPKAQMTGDYEKIFDLVVKRICEDIDPYPCEVSSAIYEQEGIEASYIYTIIGGSF